MIKYEIGGSGQAIVFTDEVVDHFLRHRQQRFWHKEAGGQLFARCSSEGIVVEEATGPRRSDVRKRTLYLPDRLAEQLEINERHERGLHYVGDWHTHPELTPGFSGQDLASIQDCFKRSHHELNAFVLVIVGQDFSPQGLQVTLHDQKCVWELFPKGPDK